MFRSMSCEGQLPSGQSSSSPPGHGVPSPVLNSQESSWIGLFSVVSRPAMSFLQRYLPGRAKNQTLSNTTKAGRLKNSFIDEENEFLIQLDDMVPLTQQAAPHLAILGCQHRAAAGLMEPTGGGTLPWLSADSLRQIGIQNAEELDLNLCQQAQIGYLSSARAFLSHIRLSAMSSQEIKLSGGKDWATAKGRTWWGTFWGGEESSDKPNLSQAEEGTVTGLLCQQVSDSDTKAPIAETTSVFIQSNSEERTLGENAGLADYKEQPANNGGHQIPDQHVGTSNHLSSSGAAAPCSEAAALTPDQDNGYSSLEEEHVQMCHLYMVKAESGETQLKKVSETSAAIVIEMEETSEEGESTTGQAEEDKGNQEDAAAEVMVINMPKCQNKAIAFIMGCPCSDDDDNDSDQSDAESDDYADEDEEDDDGFDSEGSSDLSDSEENDSADLDSELDSEAERLWSSLSQSRDPYNPQNFTARLHTSSTLPRNIPAPTPPSSAQSTPASSPELTALPRAASSPPSGSDTWDDSASASEVDEAESFRLLSSFSCSSDPYSPFNFQAPIRTRGPGHVSARAKKSSQTPAHSLHHPPTSLPQYRKDEAEERLDSGFSEPCTSSSTRKKVRFRDDVEEFFASCSEEEEDRRGPWEELARDRCRFLRRCQEVEQSIAYCLQPQHRSLVYHRLTVLYVNNA